MDLAALKAAGAFVDTAPVKESVTWNGHTFYVWVKRTSFAESEKMLAAMANGDSTPGSLMLCQSILLGDAQEPITVDDARRLEPSLAMALVQAVQRVSDRPKS